MKKIASIILAAAIGLVVSGTAFADVAPPMEPPGSNIAPGNQTMVQMVAENVLLTLSRSAADQGRVVVQADFAMQNQGTEEEVMQVRFPLENPEGWGDGFGNYPQVSDFSVQVDRRTVPYIIMEEPFGEAARDIKWAGFEVVFPVGEEVIISVRYVTQLYGYEEDWANLDYILETGAGWYGPIGSAVIVVRLPYAASPSNVYTGRGNGPGEGPTFVGNEVRWHWRNLEPARVDNFLLVLVWPNKWRNILELEAEVGERPTDVDLVIELAEAYRRQGSDSRGIPVNDDLLALGENIVLQALSLQPNSPDLHAELAAIRLSQLDLYLIDQVDDPSLRPAIRELMIAFELDPENETALSVLEMMQEFFGPFDLPSEIPPGEVPADTPTPTVEAAPSGAAEPTVFHTPVPSPQATSTGMAEIAGAATPTPTSEAAGQPSAGQMVVVALAAGGVLFVAGLAVGRWLGKRN